MSEENKELVRRWFEEVWNKGRVEAIEEMFDANGIAHGLSDDPENPIKGPRDFRPFHTVFRDAFPNMMIVIEDMVAEGDKVAARCSVRAKHEGEFFWVDLQLSLRSISPASRLSVSTKERLLRRGITLIS